MLMRGLPVVSTFQARFRFLTNVGLITVVFWWWGCFLAWPGLAQVQTQAQVQVQVPTLVAQDRVIAQDQGTWRVSYRFRLDGDRAWSTSIEPKQITLSINAWVSNARVPGLERPIRSYMEIKGEGQRTAAADLIVPSASANLEPEERDGLATREVCRMTLFKDTVISTVGSGAVGKSATASPSQNKSEFEQPLKPFRLACGETLILKLEFEHVRFLYGSYHPLLGVRELILRLGDLAFRDELPLDRDRALIPPRCPLEREPIPRDRLDSSQYVSAPHSLHLDSVGAGNQYYRFRDQDVRYSTPMRLSFWYLVAEDTQGRLKAKVTQYRNGPAHRYKTLSSGAFEICLDQVGRWVRVERIFQTEAQANELGLDFRIVGGDLGEAWIDDIVLEPVGASSHRP